MIDVKTANEAAFSLNLQTKLNEYISRAEQLKTQLKNRQTTSPNFTGKSQVRKDIENALCMVREALDEDSEGHLQNAFELYKCAVEVYIKIVGFEQNIIFRLS